MDDRETLTPNEKELLRLYRNADEDGKKYLKARVFQELEREMARQKTQEQGKIIYIKPRNANLQ